MQISAMNQILTAEQISNKSFVGPGFLEISIKTVISSGGSCPAITKQIELCFDHLAKENCISIAKVVG